jgi:hypothetical protein
LSINDILSQRYLQKGRAIRQKQAARALESIFRNKSVPRYGQIKNLPGNAFYGSGRRLSSASNR